MGWAVGYDSTWHRDIGYGVPALCDQPGCDAHIDRGLGYVCGAGPGGAEHGCGLYFCGEHGGGLPDCEHTIAEGTPDVAQWLRHKLTDPSWGQWRAECEPRYLVALHAALEGVTDDWQPVEVAA